MSVPSITVPAVQSRYKYLQVKDVILKWITEGRFSPGDKLPPERELAKICNVSYLTSRQAVGALVAQKILVRRHGSGTFVLEHSADQPAKSAKRMSRICVIVPRVKSLLPSGSGFSAVPMIFSILPLAAEKLDCEVVVKNVPLDSSGFTPLEPGSGVMMFWYERYEKFVEYVLAHEHPAILVGPDRNQPLHQIWHDARGGVMLAVEHLLELGHKRIGFMARTLNREDKHFGPRLQGYFDVLAGVGIPCDPELCLEVDQNSGNAVLTIRDFLRKHKHMSAIFCCSDRLARLVYDVAAIEGIRIPRDLSVAGYDNDPAVVECLRPGLTTVDTASEKIGMQAVRLLADLAAGKAAVPKSTLVEESLIVRDSCIAVC